MTHLKAIAPIYVMFINSTIFKCDIALKSAFGVTS